MSAELDFMSIDDCKREVRRLERLNAELLTENKRLRHKIILITKLIESGETDSALDEAQIISKSEGRK